MKPLGIYMSSYPTLGEKYKASYPTNLYQKVRLAIARCLIKWGRKLLLNNGTVEIRTS